MRARSAANMEAAMGWAEWHTCEIQKHRGRHWMVLGSTTKPQAKPVRSVMMATDFRDVNLIFSFNAEESDWLTNWPLIKSTVDSIMIDLSVLKIE